MTTLSDKPCDSCDKRLSDKRALATWCHPGTEVIVTLLNKGKCVSIRCPVCDRVVCAVRVREDDS